MTVCFETFGCRLNRAEALQQEAEYLAKGWKLTTKHAEADLFIVRACSVTRRAQHDCEKHIEHLKRHYPTKPLLIVGCLPANVKKSLVRADDNSLILPEDPSVFPVRTARAYLKVQDGCNGKCTFCIVPQFRGSSRSVPFTDLLAKAKLFIDSGYHEIVVTGCNLALYASEGKRLPELVAALASLSPSCRIRLGSLEPGAVALETVAVMIERTNVCRFLHLPIQSGSNRILSAMRRPYLTKDIDAIVKKATDALPLIGLGCDVMTGYPGETEIDLVATEGILKRHAFSNVHVFPFSARPGTIAAALPDAIPHDQRHTRAHQISALAQHLKSTAAKKFIGAEVEVVIENEKELIGWSGEYFPVEITNKVRAKAIARKDLVKVHVQDAHHGHLKAILI